MPEKKLVIGFAALCAAGAAALVYFAQVAATQAVPAYSTLSTSPDGARLLFDALNGSGEVVVWRQYKPLPVERPHDVTMFYLGMTPFNLSGESAAYFEAMEQSAAMGNNLVIAIPNDDFDPFKAEVEKTTLLKRWGIRFVSEKGMYGADPIVDKTWKPVPELGKYVWERKFGKGKVTLIASGQRLSNKGIATKQENRDLLQRLVVQHPVAVFEEAHLGINETGSIAGLARHYHLQGLLAGLILLAGLFVWSRSVSFPPAPPEAEKTTMGVDNRSMLTELMSRHLKGQLVATCVVEWNRTRGHGTPLAVPDESNSVKAYMQLQESLQKKNRFTI